MSPIPPTGLPALRTDAIPCEPAPRRRIACCQRWWMAWAAAFSLVACLGQEVEPEGDLDNRLEKLRSLSLEEVLNTEVTTLGKRPEPLFTAPGAVFLITNEELRRS